MLVAACAGAFALTAFIPAFAQAPPAVTITGTGCTQWVLSGAPPNQILTCTSGTPAIPVSRLHGPGPATGVVGVATTLAARCVPSKQLRVDRRVLQAGDRDDVQCDVGRRRHRDLHRQEQHYRARPVSPNCVNWLAAPPPMPTGCSITRAPTSQLTSAGGRSR
jgi:hypothetical protein